MSSVEALVKTLKGLAGENLSRSKDVHSEFAKGLFEGSALAYELAAQWLERARQEDEAAAKTLE